MAWSDPRTWSTSEVVTAAHMNQEVRDNLNAAFPDQEDGNTWSPTLEGVTSDASASATAGVEYTIGAIQFCWCRWVLSANGSGVFFVTLPSTASGITASTSGAAGQAIGSWTARDDSAPESQEGDVLLATATTARFNIPSEGFVQNTLPWTWASGDILHFFAMYPIA